MVPFWYYKGTTDTKPIGTKIGTRILLILLELFSKGRVLKKGQFSETQTVVEDGGYG